MLDTAIRDVIEVTKRKRAVKRSKPDGLPRKPKKRRKAKKVLPQARRFKIKRSWVLLTSVGIFSACLVLFLYINLRVERRLANLSKPSVPAIYSAPLTLFISRSETADAAEKRLRPLLVQRRYIEVSGKPKSPGEFNFSSNTLSVYVREYTQPTGEERSAELVKMPLKAESTDTLESVVLEPQVISYFGTEEMRASHFTPLSAMPESLKKAVVAIED